MSNDTQKTNPSAEALIEAKLSKSEAVKIIISDMISDLKRAQDNVEAKIKKLETVGFDEVRELIVKSSFSFLTDSYHDTDNPRKKFYLSMNRFEGSPERLPERLKERLNELCELHLESRSINKKLEQLRSNRQDAEVSMLKSLLEQSSEGRSLLDQITVIRKKAAQRMGVAPDIKLLAGK